MEISSIQNPKIKQVVKLQQNARERKSAGLFVVEGVRELNLSVRSGYSPLEVFICDEIFKADPCYPMDILNETVRVYRVTKSVYEKLAYRSRGEGVIGVIETKHMGLSSVELNSSPLLLVIEKVEKPGNLGAIFRSADAAGVTAILICDPACDPFNPNVIRASLGCIFTVPWAITSPRELTVWLKENDISIIATTPSAQTYYYELNLTGACAFIMGAEDVGLSPHWLNHSNCQVAIPMQGQIDSLNVSVSAALFIFEALRQRQTLNLLAP